MPNTPQLLATASTLDGIRECIERFYCGCSKTLIPTGENEWKLVGTYSGKELDGVRVKRARGRFRFESIQ